MLSGAKHLAFSNGYEDEILRLRLRMTLRHGLKAGEGMVRSASPIIPLSLPVASRLMPITERDHFHCRIVTCVA
jgi:hypothetical protein